MIIGKFSKKLFVFHFVIATLCLTFSHCPSVSALSLEGSVEHSERLQAASAELKVGVKFNEAMLGPDFEAATWRRIPKGLAGTWHRETKVWTKFKDYVDNRAADVHVEKQSRSTFTRGYQIDKNGDIWDCPSVRPRIKTEASDLVIYGQVTDREVLELNQDSMTIRGRHTEVQVSKQTDKIKNVIQVEAITKLLAEGPEKVHSTSSSKIFSATGSPLQLEESYADEKRVEPFKEVDNLNGVDLHDSFVRFLKANGLSDLVPTQQANVQDANGQDANKKEANNPDQHLN